MLPSNEGLLLSGLYLSGEKEVLLGKGKGLEAKFWSVKVVVVWVSGGPESFWMKWVSIWIMKGLLESLRIGTFWIFW